MTPDRRVGILVGFSNHCRREQMGKPKNHMVVIGESSVVDFGNHAKGDYKVAHAHPVAFLVPG